jgi:hypothetical protein
MGDTVGSHPPGRSRRSCTPEIGASRVSRGRGAGYGAFVGGLAAAALIGLPVALGSADARQVEWVGNLLFVAAPAVLLGALLGAAVTGRTPNGPAVGDRRPVGRRPVGRRPGEYGLVAIGLVALVLVVLAGTTNALN